MKFLLAILASIAIFSCAHNPVTGRSQLKLIPESELQSLATTQYQQFLSTNKTISGSTSNGSSAMVKKVGQRIAEAVTEYYRQNNLSNILEGYKWEFNLIENKEANAWCMPGGKVVVYSGLLPVTQNEASLAIVLGHEISHAILQHGNERMSQQLGAQAIGSGLQIALSNKPAETQNAFLTAFGVGSQVGLLLPFSRKQESEADHYGLIWAALAGYDPREAISFWKRMESAASGNQPPEFLSTHPSTGNRIAQLETYMPEALKYYNSRSSKH